MPSSLLKKLIQKEKSSDIPLKTSMKKNFQIHMNDLCLKIYVQLSAQDFLMKTLSFYAYHRVY